ncbi:hypothetical protein B0T14DRAFT_571853 [Immersiella caudata]|uniref:LysM domain-containing protein n=1 Tax=Immersiella caudata TaxID=314043 RepID=A0AA39WCX7_9PEZI|nr:hypothetical protein B0T14DRAFT_571853 [Immersiella caudata]
MLATTLFSFGFALVVGTANTAVAQITTPPAPTHAGTDANCNKWHVVSTGDGCDVIEAQYGITHAQFLGWNTAVSADCITNFWGGYAYCVGVVPSTPPGPTFPGTPPSCNAWHLVETGQNCDTIASLYGITRAQFLEYNPDVSTDCANNFWLGYAYCVRLGSTVSGSVTPTPTPSSSSPGESASSSTTSFYNSTYSIEHPVTSWMISTPTIDNSTWPPTQTQAGQPAYCNNWHLVQDRDDCDSILFQYGGWMSLADFIAWNPAVQTDCSGLYVNYWVCVGIQPQTTGIVEVIPTVTANITLPPLVPGTSTSLPSLDPVFTPTPTHGPLPTNCVAYYLAHANETCADVLTAHVEINEAQFLVWNPVLGSTCTDQPLEEGSYYCAGAYDGDDAYLLPIPTATAQPSPVPSDTTGTCVAWYYNDGGLTCDDMVLIFGRFSLANFIAWNPSVGSTCGAGLQDDMWYCVGVPGTPTTRTAAVPTTLFPPDESDPVSVSVPVTPPPSSRSTSAASPSSTSSGGGAVTTPQPIQAPMIQGCRRFYFVQPGDGCWQISTDAGISLSDFYTYNPAAAPDCSGMWANVYVCVGISGPVATFSGSPPVPT